MKYHINSKGYCMVVFSVNGKEKGFGVHQIVARQFIKNDKPELKTQVNHIDGIKTNNCIENLEWVTAKENMRHSVDVLGNYIEDKNWHSRRIYGIDINTHQIKYNFSSIIGASKFFAGNNNNDRHIQTMLWKVLNNIEHRKTYKGCMWIYEDTYEHNTNIPINYVIDRGERKLSDADIKWIRDNYVPYDNELGVRGMARTFNVNHSTISDIVNYKTYKDIV